jgi:CDP-paratose 2-epimerase
MDFRHVLITGGAGFVGSNLAVAFRQHFPGLAVTCFDNLSRRGTELNLSRLREHGVCFLHGDIRCYEDVDAWGTFDLLIDCSAQPSVHAGLDGSPLPVIQSNLQGTIHCVEAARRRGAALLFLSTSRVYPIDPLNALPFQESATRFSWSEAPGVTGFSAAGIAEDFPLTGARSLYGATKLASELILQEYAYSYSLPVLINRCGILTGPWQMGKVDQGVITYWVARHLFGGPLRYTGFGGTGKQVRDILHVNDLFQLLLRQMRLLPSWKGQVYNVGGGAPVSLSLTELTTLCQQVTGNIMPIVSVPETASVDLRIYLADARRVQRTFDWRPRHSAASVVEDIHRWMCDHEQLLTPLFQ